MSPQVFIDTVFKVLKSGGHTARVSSLLKSSVSFFDKGDFGNAYESLLTALELESEGSPTVSLKEAVDVFEKVVFG